jgi:hypothetical protein
VLVYADGLDYLRIGEDRRWSGSQPFGPIGIDAQRVTVPGVGPALYTPAGDGVDRQLAIHADGTDLFLESNLPREELLAISSSLDVQAGRLPRTWRVRRSGPLLLERVRPDAALTSIGLSGATLGLPSGYVPAVAVRTIEHGAMTATTVTFQRIDTDTAGPPITLHAGDARSSIAGGEVRVVVGGRAASYDAAGSLLSWSDHGRSWSLQGDVPLPRLVAIASAVQTVSDR